MLFPRCCDFGKVWQDALGKKKEDCKPTPLPFVIAAIGCLLMAWMLAGLMGHLADVTVRGGVISGFFVWVGFVLTTTATNQAFHGTKRIVTVIDAAHSALRLCSPSWATSCVFIRRLRSLRFLSTRC